MESHLVLASSSVYRRQLLARLGLAFDTLAPAVDERAHDREHPADLARRLAAAKARAVMHRRPGSLVIGSDQVAELEGEALGKPGTEANAVRQLRACSAKAVTFHTAVCLLGPHGEEQHLDRTEVRFRALDEHQIHEYVRRERPLDSAGAFRCEGLGIVLFEAIESRDPTALIGLPLIWLAAALARAGHPVL